MCIMPKWTKVGLPSEVFDRIEMLIKDRPDLGYLSVSSFLLDAARRRIEEIERQSRESRQASRMDELDKTVRSGKK